MKVALIIPKSSGTRARGIIKRLFGFYRLTLPVLAAYTPERINSENIDLYTYEENVEKIDFDKDFDLVGISVLTSAAHRAYKISDIFRERGTKVVLGGVHPTVMPEEAKQHADSIVRGSGESAWQEVLNDFKNCGLKQEYNGNRATPRRLPRRDIIKNKSIWTFTTIETSRGCPNRCDYCSVHSLNNGKFEQYSIDSVIQDIESTKRKYIFFLDDNLIGNLGYAKELFTRMKGIGKRWLAQIPIYIAEEDELLRLAAESGCFALYIGVESISGESLKEANKRKNHVERYSELIKKIHNYGIGIEIGIIFGFDNDDKSIFEKTLEFVDKTELIQ